ncbi:MAG: hypothetical protein WCI59_10455 [Betaproteobacteria bacterium]
MAAARSDRTAGRGDTPLTLQAGDLRCNLQADGRAGSIHWGGLEVWHGVHWLLRDPHWRTPPLRLTEPARTQPTVGSPGWRVDLQGVFEPYAEAGVAPPRVQTTLSVVGEGCGALTFTGEAWLPPDAPPLSLNRIGLCLLHPLAQAGARVEVLHHDGRTTRASLPSLVSPWPPLSGIATLRIALGRGLWAVAEFEGDSFELEDQRNNADASFKTYARSNFLPRPFVLAPGERVRQSVRLCIQRRRWATSAHRPADAAPALLRPRQVDEDPGPLDLSNLSAGPARAFELGLAIEAGDLRSPLASAARVAPLAPDVLHLGLHPREPPSDRQLRVVARMLKAAGAQLRLDLLDLAAPQDLQALPPLAQRLRAAGVEPRAVGVFPSSAQAVQAAREAFCGAHVGGGTADFFVQLNRMDRLPSLDFLAFTVCPTVHQADDCTVMSSVHALPGMLQTLRVRHPAVPVAIGPSRIAARRSPLGLLAPFSEAGPAPLASSDARDRTVWGTAWAVAQVAAALASGAQAATVMRWADVARHGRWPGAGALPGDQPGGVPTTRRRGGLWRPLRLAAQPNVLGWRWHTLEGLQDWLFHLGPRPLRWKGWGQGLRAYQLAEGGVWLQVPPPEAGAAWEWPAACVLVIDRPRILSPSADLLRIAGASQIPLKRDTRKPGVR